MYAPEIKEIFQEYALCERFGWTLEYIRSMAEEDKNNFIAIMRGETLASEEK